MKIKETYQVVLMYKQSAQFGIRVSDGSSHIANQHKEFNSHDDAMEYIKDMLKHHDVRFSINKYYEQDAS